MVRKLLLAFALLLTLCVGIMFYLMFSGPKMRDLTDLKIEVTPERVARGEYLANNLLSCVHCHTRRDNTDYSLPAVGPAFAGGDCLDVNSGFPGATCPPNLTSDPTTGLGNWTDDEILRAVREGINRDGTALFPLMPFDSYSRLSDEDAYSLVAYLRTLPAVSNLLPATVVKFPMNFVIRQLPVPLEGPVPAVSRDNEIAYGEHIAAIASCKGCHAGEIDNLSGGKMFPLPSGPLTAPNITPDQTGVMVDDYDDFVRMMRKFAPENESSTVVEPGRLTVMPWRSFAGLTDDDLHALFVYLRSVPPVEHAVEIYGSPDGA